MVNARHNLDTFPTPRHIPIHVLLPLGVVLDSSASDGHGVRTLGVVRFPTSPRNSIRLVVFVSGRPHPQSDIHGRLREVLAPIRLVILQHPHTRAINEPFDLLLRPACRVIMEIRLRFERDGMPDGAVIAGGVSFAEVIALDKTVVAAQDLPIDFIEIVGFENDAADDALTGGSFHPDLDFTAEDVKVGLDGGCIAAVGNGEMGAFILGVC